MDMLHKKLEHLKEYLLDLKSVVVTDFLNRETVDISDFSGILQYTAVADKKYFYHF